MQYIIAPIILLLAAPLVIQSALAAGTICHPGLFGQTCQFVPNRGGSADSGGGGTNSQESQQQQSAPPSAPTYQNSESGFAIKYPSNWQVVEGNPATFYPSGALGEGQKVQIFVTSINHPKVATLQGYANSDINYLRNEANSFRLFPGYPYQLTLAGLPAYVLAYSGSGISSLGGGLETDLEIFTIDQQGTLYSILYTASPDLFSRYLPVAIGMIKTFALTGVPASQSEYTSNQPPSQAGTLGPFNWGKPYGQLPLVPPAIPPYDPNR